MFLKLTGCYRMLKRGLTRRERGGAFPLPIGNLVAKERRTLPLGLRAVGSAALLPRIPRGVQTPNDLRQALYVRSTLALVARRVLTKEQAKTAKRPPGECEYRRIGKNMAAGR
jgi:hypothetical protein